MRDAAARPSSSDWLKPRRHFRNQWSGTGTTASNRWSRGIAPAIILPSGTSSVRMLEYLNRWMSSRNSPSYEAKA